jgi:hypothetical protein
VTLSSPVAHPPGQLFLVVALLTQRRPHLYQAVVTGLCLLQALLAFWFAHGRWVA